MFKCFFPDTRCASAYQIDFQELYRRGCRGVIFDIDNTLVAHGADADERAKGLFRRLQELGLQSCLLSNNGEERVRRFNQEIQTNYIFKAAKPAKRNYQKAMALMGTKAENTVFVGDQLFTDVWGAKRSGIYSILVSPIHRREELQIVLKRYLERPVLYFYERERKKDER